MLLGWMRYPIVLILVVSSRLIVAEYENFYVASIYVPNSGDKLKNLEYRLHSWDPDFRRYVVELQVYRMNKLLRNYKNNIVFVVS